MVPNTVKMYGDVLLGKGCVIGEYTVIGYPYVENEKSFKSPALKTFIGDKCIIGSHVVVYEGTRIGEETKIEDFCRIGEEVTIGRNCYILYGAKIYGEAKIGNNCVIAGFCCERAIIGNNVRLFGELLHSHRKPHLGWNDVVEKSPKIDDQVVIGFGAKIIGGIKIGKNSYITAGAIVTKNVPPKYVVFGTNNIVPYQKWKGKLKHSKFFRGG
jgi:UDP-3-O-[3-hydroxymyristoyl] glucosamine N-acyltransferase